MLRGLVRLIEMSGRVIQGEHQTRHVMEASHASEAPFGIEQCGTDPALDHLPAAPALDVSGVALDRAVEILDRIGRAQGSMQGAGQTQANDGEGLVESLTHRGRRPGMLAFERTGQVVQSPFAHRGRLTLERLAQTPCDLGVLVLGQMSEDIAAFVHLTALNDGPLAVDLGDGTSQRLRPVDDENTERSVGNPARPGRRAGRGPRPRSPWSLREAPTTCLVPCESTPSATSTQCSRKNFASTNTAAMSSSARGRQRNSCMRLRDNATNRRETALREMACSSIASGSGSRVWRYRRVDTPAAIASNVWVSIASVDAPTESSQAPPHLGASHPKTRQLHLTTPERNPARGAPTPPCPPIRLMPALRTATALRGPPPSSPQEPLDRCGYESS